MLKGGTITVKRAEDGHPGAPLAAGGASACEKVVGQGVAPH